MSDRPEVAVGWARRQVGEAATVELVRDRPWSRTWAVTWPTGRAFLKATGSASRYEAPLTELLAQEAPGFTPPVIAADADRGWLLLADAGPTLRERAEAHRFVGRFAQLQRRAMPFADRLLAAGVPDERPAQLPQVLETLLRTSPNLAGLSTGERAQLTNVASSWSADLELLDQVPIPSSVQHGDLHDNNVSLDSGGRPVFLDFGDASVAHPFTTMSIPLLMAGTADATGDRLREEYLAEFTDLAPLPDLRRVLDAALRLAWVHRATSWDRALLTAPQEHPWGDPVPETLRELLKPSTAHDRIGEPD